MASLVADYGTSSGSDNETNDDISDTAFKDTEKVELEKESEEEEEEEYEKNEDRENDGHMKMIETAASKEKLPLPTPDFNSAPTLLRTSVFSNPFVEAERAKSAILEKHVKMTPTLDDTKMINGRKICWNYRKGRCRFGHNCTFAHDSDLHRSAAEIEALRAPQETLVCQTRYNNGQQLMLPVANDDDNEIDQENSNQTANKKRKKRPGLSQSLLPSKRVFKLYKAQQQTKTVAR